LWLGAFSEQLLKMEGASFYTSAVAGTQLFHENKEVVLLQPSLPVQNGGKVG